MARRSPLITEIDFQPIRPCNGMIGFVSLLYDNRIRLSDIAVRRLKAPVNGRYFRLVYPENKLTQKNTFYPINKSTGSIIELEVNSYLIHMLGKGKDDETAT